MILNKRFEKYMKDNIIKNIEYYNDIEYDMILITIETNSRFDIEITYFKESHKLNKPYLLEIINKDLKVYEIKERFYSIETINLYTIHYLEKFYIKDL